MSPFGPLLHVTWGNVGLPKFGPAAFGVSATRSPPPQPIVSPQMWRRLSQCPTSCVVVRPRPNGAAAVPVVPNAACRITTPSVRAGPPGNCAYPRRSSERVQTHMFRYLLAGHAATPPVDALFTESSGPNASTSVFVRVTPLVCLPRGSFVASLNCTLASVTRLCHAAGTLLASGLVAR